MAEQQRKSDFTGDRFGDWHVESRAKGIGDGKRRWNVINTVTDERKTVLQTDLVDLHKFKGVHDDDLGHAFDLPDLPEPIGVGPGQCKHAIFLNDCDECSARLGTPLERPVTYTPQGQDAASARIAKAVTDGMLSGALAEQMMFQEAVASVALSQDPDMQTYYVDTRQPVIIGTAESIGPLGDMVREANAALDPFAGGESAPDPVRSALHDAMVAISEAQHAIDMALKAVINAGR